MIEVLGASARRSATNASVPCSFENFRATMTEKFSFRRASAPLFQSERIEKWDAFQGRNPRHALHALRVGGEDQDALSGHRPPPIPDGTIAGRESITSAAKDISIPRCDLTAETTCPSRRNGP